MAGGEGGGLNASVSNRSGSRAKTGISLPPVSKECDVLR